MWPKEREVGGKRKNEKERKREKERTRKKDGFGGLVWGSSSWGGTVE